MMKYTAVIMFLIGAFVLNGYEVDGGGTSANTVITIAAIPGVTAPVLGETPVETITETDQYTGTVTWDGGWAWSSYFGGNKEYTATITLTAKSGYTLGGISADFFSVAGADIVNNDADSGVVTAVFPATDSVSIGDAACGGKIAYILQSGDSGYVAGEQRGLVAATSDQTGGSLIKWALTDHDDESVPGGTETALGTGSSNTDNIITQNGAGITYAAGIAQAHNGGEYADWYLPSKDELYKLYENRASIGNFSIINPVNYWSSSESFAGTAWYQEFRDTPTFPDGQDMNVKFITLRVRAVRKF